MLDVLKQSISWFIVNIQIYGSQKFHLYVLEIKCSFMDILVTIQLNNNC